MWEEGIEMHRDSPREVPWESPSVIAIIIVSPFVATKENMVGALL